MKLGIGIGFLEGFRCGRHFISPLELQGGKTVGTLLNQVDFLFVVGAPEIELPVQSLIASGEKAPIMALRMPLS